MVNSVADSSTAHSVASNGSMTGPSVAHTNGVSYTPHCCRNPPVRTAVVLGTVAGNPISDSATVSVPYGPVAAGASTAALVA